ncbi:MAG: UxaA family hydrolase, partial [Betaproteobacteria bacterium]
MTSSGRPTFEGYRRDDGRVGVRNHVLVLSPTGLTSAAATRVAALVKGTVCVTSGFGRGQVGADAQLHFDTLAGLAAHPNVAAVVVLSAADDISQAYAGAAIAA